MKLLILVTVVAAVWGTVRRGVTRLDDFQWNLNAPWLIASGLLYLVGFAPAWLFWHRVLIALGQVPTLWESFRAYYIGHLGKYVPGKAMVFVLRVGLLPREQTQAAPAVVAVFIETLSTMAVGALLAALLSAVLLPGHPLIWLGAVALLLVSGLPTLPPVLRRILQWRPLAEKIARQQATVEGGATATDIAQRMTWQLFLIAWIGLAAGWFMLGLSLWASLRSFAPHNTVHLGELPRYTAAVALSVVAGFLSGLPGGILVREGLLVAVLAGSLAEEEAIIGALVLRLVWVVSEVVASAILYIVKRPSRGVVPSDSANSD